MEPGEKCICSEDGLYNAFGHKAEVLYRGMRLIVKSSHFVGGTRFYSFEETPADNYYVFDAFTPLRSLN